MKHKGFAGEFEDYSEATEKELLLAVHFTLYFHCHTQRLTEAYNIYW